MTRRVIAQVDELVDIAQFQAGRSLALKRQPTDFIALTSGLVSEYRQVPRGNLIRIDTQLDELIGSWDRARLERALSNLLANAIKYSPEDSEVVVTISREDLPEPHAIVTVSDHGIGIGAVDVPRIFDRFYRAGNASGRDGRGLGLAGVRHNVEQHGGSVSVRSEPGEGSEFTIQLPIGEVGQDRAETTGTVVVE